MSWKNQDRLVRWSRLVLAGVMFATGANAIAAVVWICPEDGGTPREEARVERLGDAEFRIRAAFGEGGASVLRHAVSRLDLECRNDGTNPVRVTVHLDLSDGGNRTDYDNRPEAGMPLRDFVFIQPQGAEWRQVDGSASGWITTATFEAGPGSTRLGLSPWYTHADLARWVTGLPPHPHLKKRVLGLSDGGREQWELWITDPAVPEAAKRRVFWQAREHAYETFSSYAAEGLVEFLLSEEAAEFRRRFVIVLHPMTNVDGVAQGYEYRAGYDFPDPRGTATGRMTFEAVDRIRPDFAVAWHNWIAPRDRNVVFFTDGDDGKSTPRAWHRFTQLFPSLRWAGHRWKDEANPQKYNWEGRRPLSEANVHQYAMKRYGTRVWGWEMPWWNFRVDEARALGAAFARAFLRTVEEIRTGAVPESQEDPVVVTPRWKVHEFAARGWFHGTNAFREAAWVGEFTAPSGATRVVDGFFAGGDLWRLRFSPDEPGEWTYRLRGEGVEILRHGTLRCVESGEPGFVGIHPGNPYALARSDGAPYLPMGDTCYGLLDDSPITAERRSEYLRARSAQGFNYVRFTAGHSEARAAADPGYWAWGGTPREPDLDRLNPAFFEKLDALFDELREHGMLAELIMMNFYRRPFTDVTQWTPSRERLWIRHLVSRYAAFSHLFLWTLANEYETHPDGRYRLDRPEDLDWVRRTARSLHEADPYHHLVTVHPVVSASTQGQTPRDPFEGPWRIGAFFGREPGIDVLTQQTGGVGDGLEWNETLQCWTGDAVGVGASLRADRVYGKPVINAESGYEYLRGHPTERRQVHHTDKVRRSAWRIVCSGGYFVSGFNGTIGHSDVWNRIDAPHHYTFEVRDEGAGAQMKILHDFIASLPYWEMQPDDGVRGDGIGFTLAGKVGVIYFPRGGSAEANLRDWPGAVTCVWFNPRNAERGQSYRVEGGGPVTFAAPDCEDWVLLLQSGDGSVQPPPKAL
ncbi:MAG: DUF4038 domain-containing protein [Verrucomicrobiales bacterium]|nr:DUF4038 domain-containing protein [Verrucomicrobiales bacterium]